MRAQDIVKMQDSPTQKLPVYAPVDVPTQRLSVYVPTGVADAETAHATRVAPCLHELFESQVDATPDAVALVCGSHALTYSELDAEANRMSRCIRQAGAGPGVFVGIFAHRSELPIIAILACLKAGAAYIPLDPSYPTDRVRHIADETGLQLCLTDSALQPRASEIFGADCIVRMDDSGRLGRFPRSRISRQESGVSPADLAYIIYTSGSTGRPKGVMAEHRHVSLFVDAFNKVCGTRPGDRIYQGFSLSFDGSVEEIWMAFSNGSTLVVPALDAPRFGDELAHYLESLEINYFSTVPTMLATMTPSIPTLQTVVLSGEVCPPQLVKTWARDGLRILNVYGPTEATVNTTVFECSPDAPITIGRPIDGYTVQIVDEYLKPVPDGVSGELLIHGETLARGYFNEPEMTADKFVLLIDEHPAGGRRAPRRCYRTGDLAFWRDDGDLEFLGRADSQVKIRGYRVELSEIEAILAEHPDVQSASVSLFERDGLAELAAYVVLSRRHAVLDSHEMFSLLESKVPSYMIPGFLDVLPELPRTTSGKVDRRRLPPPATPLVRTSGDVVGPETDTERVIAEVWAEAFGVPEVSATDDFFLDLGGHSLVAAQTVTKIREITGRPLAIRSAYEFTSVQRLAAHLDTLPEERSPDPAAGGTPPQRRPTSRERFESTPRWRRRGVMALQACSMYILVAPVMVLTSIVLLFVLGWAQGTVSTGELLLALVGTSVFTWPLFLAISIVAKWVLIGRYKPGEHKLWSGYYFRWWLANRFADLSGAGALAGTPLLPIYFRLMGARVGPRCTLNTAQCSAWDLLSIGADSSIGADTQMLGYQVEDGMLRIGRVDIGDRCFVGIHSALGLDVRMGDESSLDDQSLLPDRDVIPAGEGRRGSPATKADVSLPSIEGGSARQSCARRALYGAAHLIATDLLVLAGLIPVFAVFLGYWWAFTRGGVLLGVLALVVSVPIGVPVALLSVASMKRIILPRIRPGTYPVLSFIYLRKWLSDGLMAMTRNLFLPLYTTVYLPPLLRRFGAKIAPRAEISTVWSFSPELIDVGEGSFFADGSIVGGRRTHRGVFQVDFNRIGKDSFVGNSAVMPVGKDLGDGCLLGVQSLPPSEGRSTPDSTEWLGSPPFPLAHRVKVDKFDATVISRPTRRLYAERAFIDGLRILITGYFALGMVGAEFLTLYLLYWNIGPGAMVVLAPITGLVWGLAAALAVAGLKKCVMGTFRPEIKPLWSRYVWLNEMVNGVYESIFTPMVSGFLGTPFIVPFLRVMGCRIGRHTYIETLLFSEFDLVEIGDYVALNKDVVIQNHLFEDRVFKSSTMKVDDEASIGNMSVVLYDSEVGRGSVIGPLSLVMKGETIAERTRWHGIPTSQVAQPAESEGGDGAAARPPQVLHPPPGTTGPGQQQLPHDQVRGESQQRPRPAGDSDLGGEPRDRSDSYDELLEGLRREVTELQRSDEASRKRLQQDDRGEH
jgi:non-ribosomal peptide synthetase-like protein